MSIKEILKLKKIKPTIQRMKIYEYLLNNRTHPDAEKIYEDISKEISTISKTTIYNTLKEFVKKNLINAIPTEKKLVFDAYKECHSHFICDICNKVFDVKKKLKIEKLNRIDQHIIKNFCIIFKGICRDCQKK